LIANLVNIVENQDTEKIFYIRKIFRYLFQWAYRSNFAVSNRFSA